MSVADTPEPFYDALATWDRDPGVDPGDALAVFVHESGMDPRAQNPKSRATGLMQWLPKHAPIPVEQLREAGHVRQLGFARDWFRSVIRGMGRPFRSPGEVYAVVFAPGRLTPDANENTVIFSAKDGNLYSWNLTLDADRDGVIRMSDLTARVAEIKSRPLYAAHFARLQAARLRAGLPPTIPRGSSGAAAVSVIAGLAVAGAVVAGGVMLGAYLAAGR